jgi:ornithine cyclodeaminase/alanine dehydrogenase-like protein (mu-crystallin family)
VAVLGYLLPGVEVAIHDRDASRAAALAADALGVAGIGGARPVDHVREAAAGADVVVTCVSFGPVRQVMTGDWFAPGALVVAVDYATSVAAEVARGAGLFLVDEEGQFRASRKAGLFDGYPDPAGILGTAIRDGWPRPSAGRVVVAHLGVGLADLVFAAAILDAAEERGVGTLLQR